MNTKFYTTLLLLWLVMLPQLAGAYEAKSISVSFKQDEFKLSFNENQELVISPINHNSGYGDDLSAPALPMISKYVLIPRNHKFSSVNVESHRTLVMENVVMALTPIALPTNGTMEGFVDTRKPDYKPKTYPDNTVNYVDKFVMTGHNILGFLLSPFEYDAAEKKLYFHDNFQLNIQLSESETPDAMPVRNHMNDIISSMVENSGDIEDYEPEPGLSGGPIDYVIITKESLKPAFEELAYWKITKGVRTKVLTTTEIYSTYSRTDTQEQIKNCLKFYYLYHNLKYATIVGDAQATIKGCYAKGNDEYIYYDMPTDLFYACFDGQFDWNARNDDKIGAIDDMMDLLPEISVTRIPVRNITEANAFVNSIMSYERSLNDEVVWNDTILMCGTKLGSTLINGHSDSELKSTNVYINTILPFLNWNRKCLYDTYTDFPGGANYNVTPQHLQEQLSRGYAFVDVMGHGDIVFWKLENGNKYLSQSAEELINPQPTIITTTACHTNRFDFELGDCLSETFIKNEQSGVVAYYGCSREGWDQHNMGSSTLSTKYDENFYYSLGRLPEKNFGKVVSSSKALEANHSMENEQMLWLQYGLNPIGDAEMPVFTTVPQQFENVNLNINANSITINTGVDSCKICVWTSGNLVPVFGAVVIGDSAYYSVVENVTTATFNHILSPVTVCVTKQNYIPFIFDIIVNPTLGTLELNNAQSSTLLVSGVSDIKNKMFFAYIAENRLYVSSDEDGQVELYNLSGQCVCAKYIHGGKNFIDLNDCPRGVYFVRMNGFCIKLLK